jgi:hypothetical protein
MNKTVIKAAILVSLFFPAGSTENIDSQKLHRYDTVRDLLAIYNQHRVDLSKDFEESTWNETPQLPQKLITVLKEWSSNNEFSTVEATQPLFFQIKPENIVTDVNALEGGFVSGQIYRVTTYNTKTSNEQVFYIKYLRTKPILVSKGRVLGEQINLDSLSKSPTLETAQEQFDIMLPIATFQYGKKVFMVIPSAKGESFTSLVKKDLGQTVNLAFSALGKALGNLHVKIRHFTGQGSPKTLSDFINVTVVSHGDLHGDNVFYDKTTGQLSLIDVETMANSLDTNGTPNSPIFYDMFYMLLMSSKKFGDYMKDDNWTPFLSMFKAYISVYPEDERKGVYDYLIYCLKNTKNIKFTDLFEKFKIKKGFGSGRIEGARIIADALKQERDKLFPNSSPQRDFVSKISPRPSQDTLSPDQVKRAIEQRYRPAYPSEEQASSSAPRQPAIPQIKTAPTEPPMSNQHVENMSIQPGNMSKLQAFWENKTRKGTTDTTTPKSTPK